MAGWKNFLKPNKGNQEAEEIAKEMAKQEEEIKQASEVQKNLSDMNASGVQKMRNNLTALSQKVAASNNQAVIDFAQPVIQGVLGKVSKCSALGNCDARELDQYMVDIVNECSFMISKHDNDGIEIWSERMIDLLDRRKELENVKDKENAKNQCELLTRRARFSHSLLKAQKDLVANRENIDKHYSEAFENSSVFNQKAEIINNLLKNKNNAEVTAPFFEKYPGAALSDEGWDKAIMTLKSEAEQYAKSSDAAIVKMKAAEEKDIELSLNCTNIRAMLNVNDNMLDQEIIDTMHELMNYSVEEIERTNTQVVKLFENLNDYFTKMGIVGNDKRIREIEVGQTMDFDARLEAMEEAEQHRQEGGMTITETQNKVLNSF